MKITIPKGSYHQFCRNKHSSKSPQQSQRSRTGRTAQSQRQHNQLQNFDKFETYLLFLQQRDKNSSNTLQVQTERTKGKAQTSRPRTHGIRRDRQFNQFNRQPKEQQNIIKPFFPFFKCKIQSNSSPSRENHFKISYRRFKLNHKIIEENMGKAEERPSW